jgi:hypothetical protein
VDTRLAPKISQLSGVGLVSISGGQKPAVRIQANPAALVSTASPGEPAHGGEPDQRERGQGQTSTGRTRTTRSTPTTSW